jgi:hypothetical protein
VKKIQVMISEKNYERFAKILKHKRSMFVDFALTRLLQSDDPTDMRIMSFIENSPATKKSPATKDEKDENNLGNNLGALNLGGLTDED